MLLRQGDVASRAKNEERMSTRSRRRFVLDAATALGLSFISCDKNPTGPSPGLSSPPSAVVRLELVALQEIAPGESVQLTRERRRARVEYPGTLYHVITRGNQRQSIFRDDRDRDKYLEILSRLKNQFSFRIMAYVLMLNHTLCRAPHKA
jgi:hypothetical protein